MTSAAAPADAPGRVWAAVFLVSCTSIALQLDLIRVFSVSHWHNFTCVVISTALLGFGMSGVALVMIGKALRNRLESFFFWCCVATVGLGLPALRVALGLPIDSQSLFENPDQILTAVAYTLLILVPFFLAATAVGLALMKSPRSSGSLYGGSMLGTAAGGLAAVGSMYLLSEDRLLEVAFLPVLAAAWLGAKRGARARWMALVGATCLAALAVARPPGVYIEPFKNLAHLRRLESQGDARRVLTTHGPRGRLDVYESPLLHYTLFAGVNATAPPPPQLLILRDGYASGAVFRIGSQAGASILDQTPASAAYRLGKKPRVLLLGEVCGTNVWLARRFDASRITVVQPDPEVVRLMLGPLAEASGSVLSGRDISVVQEDPRVFLEKTDGRYEVIQFVSSEETGADARGAGAMQEDFLLTAEGLRAAWRRLAPSGIVSISRGIQMPARDSLKLLTTVKMALLREGVADPARHIVLFQNYLADTLLVFRTPPVPETLERLRGIARLLALDLRYPPSIAERVEPARGSMRLPSVQESIVRLLGSTADSFEKEWIYDIRAATDDRPYFRDFFRAGTISWIRRVYSDQWYRNMELGFAILVVVTLEILALSLAFTILPVALVWRRRLFEVPDRVAGFRLAHTYGYFGLIGFGFMGFEIVAISKATLLLGDPLLAVMTAITAILLGAGAGSIVAGRFAKRPEAVIPRAAAGVVAYGALLLLAAPIGFAAVSHMPLIVRGTATVAALLPLAFPLGFFFPLGLHLSRRNSEMLVPWAWAVNGFSSVVAPPALTVLAMVAGHSTVILVSLCSYAAVGALTRATFAAGRARLEPASWSLSEPGGRDLPAGRSL